MKFVKHLLHMAHFGKVLKLLLLKKLVSDTIYKYVLSYMGFKIIVADYQYSVYCSHKYCSF